MAKFAAPVAFAGQEKSLRLLETIDLNRNGSGRCFGNRASVTRIDAWEEQEDTVSAAKNV